MCDHLVTAGIVNNQRSACQTEQEFSKQQLWDRSSNFFFFMYQFPGTIMTITLHTNLEAYLM